MWAMASTDTSWLRLLATVPGLEIHERVVLAPRTSFRIGGPATAVAVPHTVEAVVALARTVASTGVPCWILGGGTNVLISDAGFPGVVVDLSRRFAFLHEMPGKNGGACWHVGAACGTGRAVRLAVSRGLAGMEVLAGVPGSMGGALIMNAGGHEGEIKSSVERIQLVTAAGEGWLKRDEAGFGYRSSDFPRGSIIVSAEFDLKPGDASNLRQKVRVMQERRRKTQPLRFPNAGSIFKNPPDDYAGRLIEASGCKGWREGDAEVSSLHANFIVNRGHATARDVAVLARRVRAEVERQTGVVLQMEVRLVGVFDEEVRL